MKTAFVLGGGGVLGAHEVGMLRALSEAGIAPDLIVGTSVGAINGAFVAADPGGAAGRLCAMWQGDAVLRAFSETLWGRAVQLASSGTHLHSIDPLRDMLRDTLPAADFTDLELPFHCVAASIERAQARWFSSGPIVPAVLASCAVPGLLPPVEIDGEHFFDGGLVHSIPVGRAIALGARSIYVLHVGRIERPLTVPRRPWEVGLVAFEIARRHRFHEEMAALPADVRVHVLPTGTDRRPPDLSQLRYRGKTRVAASRLLFFALVWLAAETATLFVCLGLWIASGFGGRLRTEPFQSRHYAIMRWLLERLYRTAVRTFGLRVEVDEPELTAEEQAARLARPVIVLSRHAGPGDSLLLVRQLLTVYGRRPRVVMKATLQLDPSFDVVGNRLPNVFISRRRDGHGAFTRQIERLAGGLDRSGALVVFPEGGNWTPGRWRRGIRRLEQQGRDDLAARAQDMPNLLPPRTGGALSAIAACPDADVIFVAHAGLDRLVSVGDVWRNLQIDQTVRAKWWRVPAGKVPRALDHQAQEQWLYNWWQRIDAWISQNRPGGPGPLASAPGQRAAT